MPQLQGRGQSSRKTPLLRQLDAIEVLVDWHAAFETKLDRDRPAKRQGDIGPERCKNGVTAVILLAIGRRRVIVRAIVMAFDRSLVLVGQTASQTGCAADCIARPDVRDEAVAEDES